MTYLHIHDFAWNCTNHKRRMHTTTFNFCTEHYNAHTLNNVCRMLAVLHNICMLQRLCCISGDMKACLYPYIIIWMQNTVVSTILQFEHFVECLPVVEIYCTGTISQNFQWFARKNFVVYLFYCRFLLRRQHLF